MQIFEAKVLKKGEGQYGPWTMVAFKDERGRNLTSFDEVLLEFPDGATLDGSVSETQKDDKTYFNFKLNKKTTKPPVQLGAVVPQPAAKPVAAPTTSQETWDKKDRSIAWMNCNNAAATLFSSTGLTKEHLAHLRLLYAEYNHAINGEQSPTALSDKFQEVIAPPVPPAPDEIDLSDVPF